MMPWQHDPQTNEWVMVDTQAPNPMTQGVTGQEPNPASRDPMYDSRPADEGPHETLPPLLPRNRTGEGGYTHPGLAFPPPAQSTYQNEDANPLESNSALRHWLETEVWAKGLSADLGTGDVIDPDTGEVVGHVPSFVRMN